MGKPGKSTRKFAKKHLKSVIQNRRKYKPVKDALRRKKTGTKEAPAQGTRNDAKERFLKMKSEKINENEIMEDDFMDDTSIEDDISIEDTVSESDGLPSEEENDFLDIFRSEIVEDNSEEEDDAGNALQGQNKTLQSEIDKHKKQLERHKQKDPKFMKFLKEHEKELLQFNHEYNTDSEEDNENLKGGVQKPGQLEESGSKSLKPSTKKVLTAAHVDAWCQEIKEGQNIGALRCLLQAYRTACHYGDGGRYDSSSILTIVNSNAFNTIMISVLGEIDAVFRKLLRLPLAGGKRESILEMKDTPRWKDLEGLIKSYFVNTLHVLSQMTDNEMISFTLQRLRCSTIFLAAFPVYLRKILKAVLHFWGSGEGPLSVVSFLFIHDMILHLGSDCFDSCLKSIYKVFAVNCKLVNKANLQQIEFLKNCVVELYGVDLLNAYQHVFTFINQLGMVLRRALTLNTKEAHKKAYSWQYMNCLELWIQFLCANANNVDFQPLSYPMAQIITGVARLVPTACYAPLRLRCTKMLNTLASARGLFIPVASLLFDLLECKELYRTPTGEHGKAFDFSTALKVPKDFLRTHAFQDECVYSVLHHLAEHLAQWSYHVAFPELAFTILVRLRRFHERTNIDRFRRQVKQLMDQVELNDAYVKKKREDVSFSPKDRVAVSSFLQAEKVSGMSPLSKYYLNLQQKAQQKKTSLQNCSVFVEEVKSMSLIKDTAVSHEGCDNDIREGQKVFNKDLPPEKSNGTAASKSKKREKSQTLIIADKEDDIVEPCGSSSEENNDDLDNCKEEDATGQLSLERQESENANRNKRAKFPKAAMPPAKFKMSGKNRQSKNKHRLNMDKVNFTSTLPDQ